MSFNKIVPAVALALFATQALSQELPPAPIRMLVGFAPGGGNDAIGQGRIRIGMHAAARVGRGSHGRDALGPQAACGVDEGLHPERP